MELFPRLVLTTQRQIYTNVACSKRKGGGNTLLQFHKKNTLLQPESPVKVRSIFVSALNFQSEVATNLGFAPPFPFCC